MKNRIARISAEMQREISCIIREDLKDNRIPEIVSVMRADVTNDLAHAKVYISVYGKEGQGATVVEALNSAAGYIRKLLGTRMQLRTIPQLHFVNDDSIEYSVHISQVLNDLNLDGGNGEEN